MVRVLLEGLADVAECLAQSAEVRPLRRRVVPPSREVAQQLAEFSVRVVLGHGVDALRGVFDERAFAVHQLPERADVDVRDHPGAEAPDHVFARHGVVIRQLNPNCELFR